MIWSALPWFDMIIVKASFKPSDNLLSLFTWSDLFFHDLIWSDPSWFDMIWYGSIWYDCFIPCQSYFHWQCLCCIIMIWCPHPTEWRLVSVGQFQTRLVVCSHGLIWSYTICDKIYTIRSTHIIMISHELIWYDMMIQHTSEVALIYECFIPCCSDRIC